MPCYLIFCPITTDDTGQKQSSVGLLSFITADQDASSLILQHYHLSPSAQLVFDGTDVRGV